LRTSTKLQADKIQRNCPVRFSPQQTVAERDQADRQHQGAYKREIESRIAAEGKSLAL
jgi:hypothetical protein